MAQANNRYETNCCGLPFLSEGMMDDKDIKPWLSSTTQSSDLLLSPLVSTICMIPYYAAINNGKFSIG